MNVLTDRELISEKYRSFRNGVLTATIATGAFALGGVWPYPQAAAPVGAPEIVRQTPSQTVARIPTLHAGKRVDCTVTIDQAKNIWSITC